MLCEGKISNKEFHKARDQVAADMGLSSLRSRTVMKRPAAALATIDGGGNSAASSSQPQPTKEKRDLPDVTTSSRTSQPAAKRPAVAHQHSDDESSDFMGGPPEMSLFDTARVLL